MRQIAFVAHTCKISKYYEYAVYEYAVIFFFYFVSILYSVGFVCLDFVCLGNQSLRVARLVTSKVSIGIRATSMDSRDVDNLVEKSSILRR